jgi:hypothetical protein
MKPDFRSLGVGKIHQQPLLDVELRRNDDWNGLRQSFDSRSGEPISQKQSH